MSKKINSQKGFTLIELLVVATIMIVLTTIGLVSYQQSSRNGRNAKRKSDLESVRQALTLYRNDNNLYPVGSNFDTMLGIIADYVSFGEVADPKFDGTADDYTYDSATGATFDLCATLELKTGTQAYCISNL